jgi:hypothetical protein
MTIKEQYKEHIAKVKEGINVNMSFEIFKRQCLATRKAKEKIARLHKQLNPELYINN